MEFFWYALTVHNKDLLTLSMEPECYKDVTWRQATYSCMLLLSYHIMTQFECLVLKGQSLIVIQTYFQKLEIPLLTRMNWVLVMQHWERNICEKENEPVKPTLLLHLTKPSLLLHLTKPILLLHLTKPTLLLHLTKPILLLHLTKPWLLYLYTAVQVSTISYTLFCT